MDKNIPWFNDVTGLKLALFNDYYNRISLLAHSMFKWNDLPKTVDERFIEKTLFKFGRALFINDTEKGYLGLQCTPADQLNVYETPIAFNAWGINYPAKTYKAEECVLIRNNYLDLPTISTIQLYAQKLCEIDRTIMVNIQAQKTPIMILCDEKTRLTMTNLYNQYSGDKPFIFGTKSLDLGSFTVLKTDAPFVADKLSVQKHEVWNEVLTFLGINNANTDKKERLITDEATANDEQVSLSADVFLLARQLAAKQINEMFGLNITVERRSISNSELAQITGEKNNDEGDGENG
jgi:hypothetical protein